MPEGEKIYFKNLDAIRFIAALLVYLHHGILNSFDHLNIENPLLKKLILLIFHNGKTGVSIFFVLSGFLITYLLITEYEIKGKINIKKFYFRRFLRIWPLYYAVVIFTFLIYPGLKILFDINQPLVSNIYYHLTFLSNFDVINVLKDSSGMFALSQNITWSVSIEEQFYLFWPLLFFLPKKFWGLLIILVIFLSFIFRLHNYDDSLILNFHTFSCLTDLAVGGGLALLVKKNKKVFEFFSNTNTKTHLFLFAITLLFLYHEKDLFPSNQYLGTISQLLKSILFGLIITSQALTIKESFLNLFKFKFGSNWGKYTYGIYLLHPIVILLLDVTLRTLNLDYQNNFMSHFGIGILGFIFTLIASKISYNYFESYFLKIKTKYQVIKKF